MQRRRLPNLTGARYFAALAVLIMHLGSFLDLPVWIAPLIHSGGLGVVFFFVLSGHVLAWNYQNKMSKSGRLLAIRDYAVRRFARIYPLYFLVLLIYLVIAPWKEQPRELPFLAVSWLAHATAIQAWLTSPDMQQYWNAPGWSISSECFFYACFPFLLLARQRLSSRRALLATTVYALVVPLLMFYLASHWLFPGEDLVGAAWLLRLPPVGLIPFIVGIFSGVQGQGRAQQHPHALLLASPLLPMALLTLCIYLLDQFSQQIFYLQALFTILLYTPLLLWLTSSLAHRGDFLDGLLNRSFLRLLGESSYALYITHWLFLPLFPTLIRLINNGFLALLVALVGLTAISVATHLFFELPVRRWINNRFTSP
jgi:peptidoglycan/LPS O-acetylase OafA/YrhL